MASFSSDEHIQHAIEAMLFVSDQPVSAQSLAHVLSCTSLDVEEACQSLENHLRQEDAGIQLHKVAGGWQLYTHPALHDLLEKYVLSWESHRLSQAALETLSIIAYIQPITRAGVAQVRGVNSDSSISSLIEKGYVREVGVQDSPENPVLYGTTKTFLQRFGINSLRDLPDVAQYAPDEKTRDYIVKRLSSASSSQSIGVHGDSAYSDADDGDAEANNSHDTNMHNVHHLDDTYDASSKTASDDRDDQTNTDTDISAKLKKIATDAFAQASGVTDKIDFDELRFDQGDDE